MSAKLLFLMIIHILFYLLIIYFISKKTRQAIKQNFKYFLWGAVSIFPFISIIYFDLFDKHTLIASAGITVTYLLLAIVEEFDKSLSLIRKLKPPGSIINYICLALGFACIENFFYSYRLSEIKDFFLVVILRLILDSSIHAFSSSVVTLCLMYLKKLFYSFSTILLYLISVFTGGLVHFCFNYLQLLNLHFLNIPLLAIGIYVLYYLNQKYWYMNPHPGHLAPSS
jgi:hypothetical protein